MRIVLALVGLLVVVAPSLALAGERRVIEVRAVSWFQTGGDTYINVVIDGQRWALKGDHGLDPGVYPATLDRDVVRIDVVRDLKGNEHRDVKYHVAAHSWLHPVR